MQNNFKFDMLSTLQKTDELILLLKCTGTFWCDLYKIMLVFSFCDKYIHTYISVRCFLLEPYTGEHWSPYLALQPFQLTSRGANLRNFSECSPQHEILDPPLLLRACPVGFSKLVGTYFFTITIQVLVSTGYNFIIIISPQCRTQFQMDNTVASKSSTLYAL